MSSVNHTRYTLLLIYILLHYTLTHLITLHIHHTYITITKYKNILTYKTLCTFFTLRLHITYTCVTVHNKLPDHNQNVLLLILNRCIISYILKLTYVDVNYYYKNGAQLRITKLSFISLLWIVCFKQIQT